MMEDTDSRTLHRGLYDKVWQVHKFGGTSVADAGCFLRAISIIKDQLHVQSITGEEQHQNLAVVVSAMGGKPKVTDLLLSSVTAAANREDDKVKSLLDMILQKHVTCIDTLLISGAKDKNKQTLLEEANRLKRVIENDISDIKDILKTVSLMKWQATRISELVSGYGETWSAQILTALLSASFGGDSSIESYRESESRVEHHFRYVDARRVITIDEEAITNGGAVCWEVSLQKLKDVFLAEWQNTFGSEYNDENPQRILHFVVTGYIASNTKGVATTLQRDGSDYTAAIMGRMLESSAITIWTDVDGVLSADPRRVPDSYVLNEVSFNEAMELSYFGAKVIHPKTMQPAIMGSPQIPIFIRNTFNASFRGSRIYTSSSTHTDRDRCVCGFSSIEKMAIINVEGSGMVGVKGVARRLFGTLESIDVNVVLIAQASSEHTITFATTMSQVEAATGAIEEEFHKELKQNHISSIEVVSPCSIIAAVGDGMHDTTGVAGRFFSALGDAKINILAMCQGSNERNISAVVQEHESTRALRAVHAAFRLSHTTIRVGIIGMNDIGSSLLRLFELQRDRLKLVYEIDVQVSAVLKDNCSTDIVALKNKHVGVNSDSITKSAFDITASTSPLPDSSVTFQDAGTDVATIHQGGLQSFAHHVQSEDNTHSFIFDCTANEEVGSKHVEWLESGINVITANNTALSGSKELRKKISNVEKDKKAKYLREVTIGGGLPIISTLRDLLSTGDQIRRLDGILSVTMSYVMYRVAPPPGKVESYEFDERIAMGAYGGHSTTLKESGTCSFSDAVKEAIETGLTEEDPIKDLSNEYTARCLMVLARELGIDQDYDVLDIQRNSDSLVPESARHYYEFETELDRMMEKRVEDALKKNCVPRHISSIDVKTGEISVSIKDVPINHVFATTPPSCECMRFFTKRHRLNPLLIQGPSAGVDSTASALLAELLNVMGHKVGKQSGRISRSSSSATLLG